MDINSSNVRKVVISALRETKTVLQVFKRGVKEVIQGDLKGRDP